jgi:hypothetical protein
MRRARASGRAFFSFFREDDMPDDYDFEQMIAEAKVRLGRELVLKALKATVTEFGWPLSSEGRIALLLQLAVRCRAH